MFGYIQVRKPELKIKDYETYQAFYCGLCSTLWDLYGALGSITLTYDMTFLVLLLSSVYDLQENRSDMRCIVHPAKKRKHISTKASEYASHMNIILTYYHFIDDINDEASKIAFAESKVYTPAFKKAVKRYPKKATQIENCLNKLSELEKANASIEDLTDCFGRLMMVLFNYKKDAFSDYLKALGYHLGRFIYVMDAYDDMAKDKENGAFNPLVDMENVDSFVEQMLYNEMSEAAAAYRMLPVINYADILGNIIYAGAWNRFDSMKAKKEPANKAL
ncbi:MAG: DUF5685 family protein [Lachnospiraceae bacterium]|nr:DUF5685 family protein [Lachnospiraceae bacterium]